jgi:hypothetical protein
MTEEKNQTLVKTEKGICILKDGQYVPLTEEELQQLMGEKPTPKAEKVELTSSEQTTKRGVFGLEGVTSGKGSKWDKWKRNEQLRKAIISTLIETKKPMTVEEVCEIVNCAWVTARQILTDLALEGKLKCFVYREGYGKLFQINEEWLAEKAAEKEVNK